MAPTLGTSRGTAKSRRFPERNQNFPGGNRISLVMQKVKASLPKPNSAEHLAVFTNQPLSICQKLLSGHRVENRTMMGALLRSRFIIDVLLAETEGANDPTVRGVRRAIKRLRLEGELKRLDDGEDE